MADNIITPTPENPIPDVDEIKPGIPDPAWNDEGGGGGTGGGVLKINVEQGQMDKTYAEIKAAFMEGIVFCIYPTSDGDVLCIVSDCYDGEEGCYLGIFNTFGGSHLTFECQTVDDYPVAQMG